MTSKPAHSVFVLCCLPSHTHTHTLIHIHIYSHTHEHTYIPTHGCTYTTHTHTSTSSQMHSHTHINTHKYMHIDIYSNTHTPHTSFWLLPPPPLWQKFMLSHKISSAKKHLLMWVKHHTSIWLLSPSSHTRKPEAGQDAIVPGENVSRY